MTSTQSPLPAVDRKSKLAGPPPSVVVVVGEADVLVVEPMVDVVLEVLLVEPIVEVDELVVDPMVDVVDDVDEVLVVEPIVEVVEVVEVVVGASVDVVVVALGLHGAGNAPTMPGTDAAPAQSTS